MLHYFFDYPVTREGVLDQAKYDLKMMRFSKLKIGAYPNIIDDHCGQYPTIFISFKDIKEKNYDDVMSRIGGLIQEVYSKHNYLLHSSQIDDTEKNKFTKYLQEEINKKYICESLRFLSSLLHTHFDRKVVILIDEYDTPMNDWYVHALSKQNTSEGEALLQQILDLFRGILGAALKDNSSLERAAITGILRIAKSSLFSGLNNIREDCLLDKRYAPHFGFTEDEVRGLLKECDRTETDMEDVKQWYNGYTIGGITIYNPWSIVNYVDEHELKGHWAGTAGTELLEKALILDDFQEELQTLIEGGTVSMIADPKMVFADIQSSAEALYNLLLFSGYLTPTFISVQDDGTSYKCQLKIPNHEIKGIFSRSVKKWLTGKLQVKSEDYERFLETLLKGDYDLFIEKLRTYMTTAFSFYSTGPKNGELFYNGFMLGLMASLSTYYVIETEKESGLGRIDMVLIPKPTSWYKKAFLLEFKRVAKEENLKAAAEAALAQIQDKKYRDKVTGYDVVSIGFAFCGKEVEMVVGG